MLRRHDSRDILRCTDAVYTVLERDRDDDDDDDDGRFLYSAIFHSRADSLRFCHI